MKFTLTILLFIRGLNLDCTTGCLSCIGQKCLKCDSDNQYVIDVQGSCEKSVLKGCLDFKSLTICKKCVETHYLDQGNCIELESSLPDCNYHSSPTACKVCKMGFLLGNNNLCLALENPIPNCLIHNKDDLTKCLTCDESFILALDNKSCEITPSISRCFKFSFLDCQECDNSNSLLLDNKYLLELNSSITSQTITTVKSFVDLFTFNIRGFSQYPQCFELQIDGCNILDPNGNNCQECDQSFFKNADNICIQNPSDIEFCETYTSRTTCSKCKTGYHFKSKNICTSNFEILNCMIYDQSSFQTICLQCLSTHLLNKNNCDTARSTQIISQCQTISITSNSCQICNQNFVQNFNSTKCLTALTQCNKYDNSHKIDNVLKCSSCNDGYFLNQNGFCTKGSLQHCVKYDQKSQTEICTACEESHYLVSNRCDIRTKQVENCQQQSLAIDKSCNVCNKESFQFDIKQGCRETLVIHGCLTYEKFNTCSRCQNFHNLTLDKKKCSQYNDSENCLFKFNGVCQECKIEFMLNNGLCHKNYEFENLNCLSNNVDGKNSTFKCNYCEDFHIPISYQNYICQPESQINTEIQGCSQYSQDGLLCEHCQGMKVLSLDSKECNVFCSDNETLLLSELKTVIQVEKISYLILGVRKCVQRVNNCLVAVTSLNQQMEYQCLECPDGFIDTGACNANHCSFRDSTSLGNEDLGASYAIKQCESKNQESDKFYPNLQKPNEHCRIHKFDNQHTYYCQICNFGYTGKVLEIGDYTHQECDVEVIGCDSSIIYGGGSWNTDYYMDFYEFTIPQFTCNKCTDQNEIPFFHIFNKYENRQNNLVGPFNILDNNIPINSKYKEGHSTTCRTPSQYGLSMNDEQFKYFPSNCGLGVYFIDIKKLSNNSNQRSVACFSCKPGYKPVYDDNGYFINECIEIPQCDNTNPNEGWFNNCKICLDGYVHEFDQEPKYDSCVFNKSENCLIATEGTVTDFKCSFCEAGFVLNSDNKCNQRKPSNCNQYNDFLDIQKSFSTSNSLMFFLNGNGIGCTQCENGWVSVFQTIPIVQCTPSIYAETNSFVKFSNFIKDCKNYGMNVNTLLCYQCINGFTPVQDLSNCQPEISGCKYINTKMSTQCSVCLDSHVLMKNYSCKFKTINNCSQYSEGQDFLLCENCVDRYFLMKNVCYLGKIRNCLQYQSENQCSSCELNYFQLKGNEVIHCGSIPEQNKCQIFELDNSQLKCTECQNGYSTTDEQSLFNKNNCISLASIENCMEYDASSLSDSTLGCLLCTSGNYYDQTEHECIPRNRTDLQCHTYDPFNDNCQDCNDNYILENNKCAQIVSGINQCSIYKNESICQRCKNYHYLEANKCLPSDTVDNCTYYFNKDQCMECDTGLILVENVCETQNVSNCSKVLDPNTCEICNKGFYLATQGSKQEIKNCLRSTVPNCRENVTNKNICSICYSQYYINENNECAISSNIPGCEIYKGDNQCSNCFKGYVLTSDYTKCEYNAQINNIQPNCSKLSILTVPKCVICQEGYYFQNHECIDCMVKNCMFCNPLQPNQCLLCKSNYQMITMGGNCIKNPNEDNSEEPGSSVIVENSLIVLFLTFIF